MTVKHKPLLRLDFSQGIPQEYRSMVVVSQLISDKNELEKAIENLRRLKAANNYNNIRFCLLVDFLASDKAMTKEDEELLRYAKKLFYQKLNPDDYNIFGAEEVMSRPKKYSGEERKRGAFSKLVSFCAARMSMIVFA